MSFDLVLFGGTGDLAWRKLMPALFQAFRHGTLPAGGRIIGVARDPLSAEQYRAQIHARFEQVDLTKRPSLEEFTRFAALLEFVQMDLSRPADYARLVAKLAERQADIVVMYVATAPALFTTIVEQLAAAGLNTPQTRVVLEKPLGHDLASNRAINHSVSQVFSEKPVYHHRRTVGRGGPEHAANPRRAGKAAGSRSGQQPRHQPQREPGVQRETCLPPSSNSWPRRA